MSNVNNHAQAGSYAVSTVYSMPWTKKKPKEQVQKKKPDKKIVHDIFEECAEISNDPYWVSVFKESARERLPRGFSYKNGMLIHKRGSKTKRIMLSGSIEDIYDTCIDFFKANAGLMSKEDRKRVQKEEEEKLLEQTSIADMVWKDIKIERVKDLLISEFISNIADSSEMTISEKRELTTTIKRGFILKYFTSKNIIMENGKIVEIDGLIYDESLGEYVIDDRLKGKRPSRRVKGLGLDEEEESKPKISFMAMWEKYLDNMDKKSKVKTSHSFQDNSKSISSNSDIYSQDYSGSPSESR